MILVRVEAAKSINSAVVVKHKERKFLCGQISAFAGEISLQILDKILKIGKR